MSYKNLNLSIVCTIAAVCAKYNNKYCFITQERFLQLLKEFYDITISRRTLNYHLKELEENNYIKRRRRITRNKDGTVRTLPTMYALGQKAYFLFKRVTAIFDRFIRRTDVQIPALINSLCSALDNKKKKNQLGKKVVNKKTPSKKQTDRQNNLPSRSLKKKESENIQLEKETSKPQLTPEYWKKIEKNIEQIKKQRKNEVFSFSKSVYDRSDKKEYLRQYWEKVKKDFEKAQQEKEKEMQANLCSCSDDSYFEELKKKYKARHKSPWVDQFREKIRGVLKKLKC